MNDGKILYMAGLILSVGVLSWFIRALPFLVFGRGREIPKVVSYIGKVLSSGAIAMLVVYCFAGHVFGGERLEGIAGLRELAAGALTVALQWIWRQAPLSIAAGTALYMFLA